MSFLYFAYGSNLWPPQLASRCGSATAVGAARLTGWLATYDKPGADGSAKLNLRESRRGVTYGALYEIEDSHRMELDRAEPGYTPFGVIVQSASGDVEALTYRWADRGTEALPADWYVALAKGGARHHGLPEEYVAMVLDRDSAPDQIAPGIVPQGRRISR